MQPLGWLRLARRHRRAATSPRVSVTVPATAETPRDVDIRITADLLKRVRWHVENFAKGEEAGFLLCSTSQLDTSDVLLARDWCPVPEAELPEKRQRVRALMVG